jgi:hypothetical protein
MPANQADVKAFLRRVSRPDALESAPLVGTFPCSTACAFRDRVSTLVASAIKTLSDQPPRRPSSSLEAINIPGERPAVDIIGGDYQVQHPRLH